MKTRLGNVELIQLYNVPSANDFLPILLNTQFDEVSEFSRGGNESSEVGTISEFQLPNLRSYTLLAIQKLVIVIYMPFYNFYKHKTQF